MRFRDQTGLDGIEIDVALRGREVLFVSDEAIPIVGLPEFACASEYDVPSRAVKRFHEPTIVPSGMPGRMLSRTWTWFGMIVQACRR